MALVGFADYRRPEPGLLEQPHGLEWFCPVHQKPAQALAHLPIEKALGIIRARERRWWKRLFAFVEKRTRRGKNRD